jgi:DNA polymerase III gamma/tau subunit
MLANTKNTEPFSLIAFASFLAQNKKGFKMGLYIVSSCFRDALIFKETRKSQMLINQDKAFFVEALAMRLSGEQILQNIMLVEKAEKTIEHNGNKLLTLETMAFKLKH